MKSHLDMPEEDDCPFCAYLSGRRPYTIVSRTSVTATLVTREQRGEPHLLVVPTRHVPSILELPSDGAQELLLAVRNAARLINESYQAKGISIWQNNGVPAGQAISHLHFHVAGTLKNGGTNWGSVPELSLKQTDAIAAILLVKEKGVAERW